MRIKFNDCWMPRNWNNITSCIQAKRWFEQNSQFVGDHLRCEDDEGTILCDISWKCTMHGPPKDLSTIAEEDHVSSK